MDSTLLSQYALIDTAILVAVPLVLVLAARQAVAAIDEKGMFHVPFCRSLAFGTGILIGLFFLLRSGLLADLSVLKVWQVNGPWHDSFMALLVGYAGDFRWPDLLALGSGADWFDYFVTLLGLSAGALSLVSFAIAILAWRSVGAWRGIASHVIISAVVAVLAVLAAIALFWTLHWLNFWLFLVLFIVIEMRRREDTRVMRLSF